jgi:hypothetical protein
VKCLGFAECQVACFCNDQPDDHRIHCERCAETIGLDEELVEHEGLDWHMNCLVLELAECAKQWSCSTWFPGHDFVTAVAS